MCNFSGEAVKNIFLREPELELCISSDTVFSFCMAFCGVSRCDRFQIFSDCKIKMHSVKVAEG